MKEDEVGCKILHRRTKIVSLFHMNTLNSLANETAEEKKKSIFCAIIKVWE